MDRCEHATLLLTASFHFEIRSGFHRKPTVRRLEHAALHPAPAAPREFRTQPRRRRRRWRRALTNTLEDRLACAPVMPVRAVGRHEHNLGLVVVLRLPRVPRRVLHRGPVRPLELVPHLPEETDVAVRVPARVCRLLRLRRGVHRHEVAAARLACGAHRIPVARRHLEEILGVLVPDVHVPVRRQRLQLCRREVLDAREGEAGRAHRVSHRRVAVRRHDAGPAPVAHPPRIWLVRAPLALRKGVVAAVIEYEVGRRCAVGERHLSDADPEHLRAKYRRGDLPLLLVLEREDGAAPVLAALLSTHVVICGHCRRVAAPLDQRCAVRARVRCNRGRVALEVRRGAALRGNVARIGAIAGVGRP